MTPTDMQNGVDEQFGDVLAAYLEAADAGWAPDRQLFLRCYPLLRPQLEEFFTAQERLTNLTASFAFPTPNAPTLVGESRPGSGVQPGSVEVLLQGQGGSAQGNGWQPATLSGNTWSLTYAFAADLSGIVAELGIPPGEEIKWNPPKGAS